MTSSIPKATGASANVAVAVLVVVASTIAVDEARPLGLRLAGKRRPGRPGPPVHATAAGAKAAATKASPTAIGGAGQGARRRRLATLSKTRLLPTEGLGARSILPRILHAGVSASSAWRQVVRY